MRGGGIEGNQRVSDILPFPQCPHDIEVWPHQTLSGSRKTEPETLGD